MSSTLNPPSQTRAAHDSVVHDWSNISDLIESLGGVAPERIRFRPVPGTANEDDVVANNDGSNILLRCELIEGVLVEKATMSYFENRIALILGVAVQIYLRGNRVGAAFTEGAMYQMSNGNVRLPDLSVTLRHRFPTGRVERVSFAPYAPDLAVEVLSKSNTRGEIAQKRSELFESGTALIWVVDPVKRNVEVFTGVDTSTTLTESDTLAGGTVLPGFELSIAEWFREAEEV